MLNLPWETQERKGPFKNHFTRLDKGGFVKDEKRCMPKSDVTISKCISKIVSKLTFEC